MESIRMKLNNAWIAFDTGDLPSARALYSECLQELSVDQHDLYTTALMGLIYVESFSGSYENARKYAHTLLKQAWDEQEKHIYLHQSGMVERMAGSYKEAMDFFLRERSVLLDALSDDLAGISANYYETGYIKMKQTLYRESEQDLRHALEAGSGSGDLECIGCAYRGLGKLYGEMGRYDLSCEMYHQAMDAFRKANDLFAVQEIERLLNTLPRFSSAVIDQNSSSTRPDSVPR